jgi:hypothetical protein
VKNPAAGLHALRPRRPDALLDLAPVRQPVLRVPHRAALPGDPEHVAGYRLDLLQLHCAAFVRDNIRDISARTAKARYFRRSGNAGQT